MRILAIDTALESCSAAILDAGEDTILAVQSQVMIRGHAEALMPIIAAVTQQSGLAFSDLDRIAVTVGPGSFTGLRVGIAAGRGIAVAIGKPVVGVTTLAALAAPHIAADASHPVAAAIDARHNHVYFQLFYAGGQSAFGPAVVAADVAARMTADLSARIVGSGAALLAAAWPQGATLPVMDDRRSPDIAVVARLGADALEMRSPPKPLYIRPVDASPPRASQILRR